VLCVIRHDGEKLLLVDFPVLIQVKLLDHRLSVQVQKRRESGEGALQTQAQNAQLLVVELLPNLFRDAP
jgi:hypothetical protein